MICAIAQIAFFNRGGGNQSDLAVRLTSRLVRFWGLATDCAMTGGGWIVDGLLDRDRGIVDRGKPFRFKLKFRPVEGIGFFV